MQVISLCVYTENLDSKYQLWKGRRKLKAQTLPLSRVISPKALPKQCFTHNKDLLNIAICELCVNK